MKCMIFLFGVMVLLSACVQQTVQDDTTDDLTALAGTWQSVIGEPFASFSVPQDSRLSAKQVAATGRPFTKAWQFATTSPFETPYSLQMGATNTLAIAKDDVLMVQFWARAVGTSQTAQTEFVLEEGAPDYAKSLTMGVSFGRTWKLFQVPFLAHRSFAAGEASLLFRLGYPNQAFELAGVRVVSFGKSRTLGSIPSRGFEYPGIEADAAWRQAANARIDQHRKGNLRIKVVNATGNPVSGATVKVEMQRHAFPFGSAVDAERLFNNQTYQNYVVKLFNRVVLENDLKWTFWECCRRDQTPNVALRALDFFKSKNISVRGHTLIWPCDADFCLPTDVVGYLQNRNIPALRSRIDSHLVELTSATKGKLVEWDVVNEPSANKRIFNVTGEDEMASWYKRVKQLDPRAKLFLNDYGNLGEGTLDVEYKRIIERMLDLGAPLEGIGLQAHFAWDLTPPEELHQRLNDFGKFGLPLAITEFDVNISDEQLQAKYLRDTLTVAFANPNVTSFLMWGFWEGQHWLPQAALYRQDWSIKPNGEVWNDLIFKQWWTTLTGTSDNSGSYGARGFLGQYKITATKNGKTVSQTVNLPKAGATFTLTLR